MRMASNCWLLILTLVGAALELGFAAECHGKVSHKTYAGMACIWYASYCTSPSPQPSPDAKPNLHEVLTAAPKLVSSAANGKLLTVGDGDDLIHLLHVWGEGLGLHVRGMLPVS